MSEHEEESLLKKILKIALGLILFVSALVFERKSFNIYLVYCFYLSSYLVLGYGVIFEALYGLFHGDFFDENFLMFVATVGAAVLGDYKEAVSVMLFYMIGETVEDLAVDSSKDKIEKLLEIEPESARVVSSDVLKEVKPQEVKKGQIIRVLAGERVPLDGMVKSGSCLLDVKTLTGESNPIFVTKGDEIKSGSIVLDKPVDILVTRVYSDSTISKIIELTKQARERKAPTEKFITSFARIYTPVVIFSAVALSVIPSLFDGQWTVWIHRALTFLIISCPCALVLSVPLAFFGGVGACASEGILVKGADNLQNLSGVKTVAFDKTGTLTEGHFSVNKIIVNENKERKFFLELAYSIENKSIHPLAKSVCGYCKAENISFFELDEIEEIPGKGLKGKYIGKTVLCGNSDLLKENGIEFDYKTDFETCIYLSFDNEFLGCFCLADNLKSNVLQSVAELEKLGVEKTVLLSGDKTSIALNLAKKAGLSEAYGELLPQDKVLHINKLKEDCLTAYVGDGINDAPVLASADVGISMGTEGSAAAIEASGVVIAKDDISRIPVAIRCARKTMRIAKQNIVFALTVKLICLVLGSLGFASMYIAVFADTGVALICILNSLRALKV